MAKSVAKVAPKKMEVLAVGDWVEVTKYESYIGGHKKGAIGVVTDIELNGIDGADDHIYIANVDKEGREEIYYSRRACVAKIKAPAFVVLWAYEDRDPFTYARTREEADKLAARKRVDGKKVIWSQVFKAV